MNTAKPIGVSEYYIKRIAKGMEDYLWENLFKSLFDTLKDNSVINSKSDLLNAIRTGQIYYLDGAFRSENKKFSNVIATELELLGARFKYGAYYLPKAQIPVDVLNIIGITQARASVKLSAIDKILAKYLTAVKIPLDLFIKSTVNMAFKKLEKDILTEAIDKKVPIIELGLATPKNTVNPRKAKAVQEYFAKRNKERDKLNDKINKAKKEQKQAEKNADIKKFNELTDKISELTAKRDEFNLQTQANIPLLDVKIDDLAIDYRSKKIAEDYTYNMKYWIQKWEAKNIIKMREDIVDMYQKGARISAIQEYLEKRWKIARDKAKFLAENECGLVSATVQATMWQETGATKFVWRRSVSKEKRKLHKEYYNKTFEFANPPIIDEKLGIKGLPRQIWNCKCQMSVVVPSIDEIMEARKRNKNVIRRITNAIKDCTQCDNNPWRYRRFGQGQTL